MRNFCIRDTKWKRRGRELDVVGSYITTANRHFYLLGRKDEILAFNNEFSGEIIIKDGVMSVNDASKEFANIICVSHVREEYEAHLTHFSKFGYKENENFFQSDLFRTVYFLYKHNEIRLDRMEIFMTSHCTLNCEKCIAYMPYFTMRSHMPLNTLTNDLDMLFTKVDFIYKFKCLGGEVLLYPHLIEYLKYLCDHYRKQIGSICLGTNATILPSQELMDICRKHDIMMDVSDYAEAVHDKCKLPEVLAILQEYGVRYAVKRTGEQWLDMGFPTHSMCFSSKDAVAKHFHKCAMFCREFYDGKFYFCCSNFAAVQAGLFPVNENDYLDFRHNLTKKEILEFEIGFSMLGHTTFCAVCRGCSMEANPIRVPVAKQTRRSHGLHSPDGAKF